VDDSRDASPHTSSKAILQDPLSYADCSRSGSRTDLRNTLGGGNALRRDVSTTSSGEPLKQLRGLDKSSSKFHEQVSDILYGEEYKQWVPELQGDDLVGFVDYLNQVRHPVSLVRSPYKPL